MYGDEQSLSGARVDISGAEQPISRVGDDINGAGQPISGARYRIYMIYGA